MTAEVTVVEASKTKTLLIILGSALFVALGGWFLSLDQETIRSQPKFNNPIFVYSIGVASVLFFGFCFIAGIWRLFSNKPGLELNSEGVKVFNIGQTLFIPWAEIEGMSLYEQYRQKILVLNLHNPNKYINIGGKFRQIIARASYNECGSPISISPNSLKLNLHELVDLFEKYLLKYAKNA